MPEVPLIPLRLYGRQSEQQISLKRLLVVFAAGFLHLLRWKQTLMFLTAADFVMQLCDHSLNCFL